MKFNWKYQLILWSKNAESSTQAVYELLRFLSKLGEEFEPKFYGKKRIPILDIEYINNLILENKDKTFPQFGSNLVFSTSYPKMGISYRFSVGITSEKFPNTFIIEIPADYFLKDTALISYDKLLDIFDKSIKIFNPFWGCVLNTTNHLRFASVFEKIDTMKIPLGIFWLNYFDTNIEKLIGYQNLEKASFKDIIKKDRGGIYVLQHDPFLDYNYHHLELQNEIIQKLNFQNLFNKFPR